MTKDKEKRMTPEIRFKGFSGDWEQRKLNEISDIYDGTHQTPKYQDEGVMFLSVENIKTLISNKFISHEAFESEFRIRPQRGDVLITRIGNVGTANVVETDENLAYYVSLALLKSEKLKPYFLQSSIQSPFVQKQIWKRTLHIAFPKKINKNEIGQVPINIPTTDEQVEIGTFFKHLDDAITLHQQKYELLIKLKKAYLQLIFPKTGESTPKVRFADFHDNWEQCKLGDLGSVAMNKRIFKNQTSENGEVPFFKIGTFGSYPDAFISRKLFEEYKSKYPYPEVGDILISASGSIGRTVVYQGEDEYFQDSNIVWLKHNGRLDNKFLKQFYSIVKWQGLEGSTIKRLYNKNILDTNISVPTLAEQNKLGAFFEQLENAITLRQQKVASLKSLKQAYLQKMFV